VSRCGVGSGLAAHETAASLVAALVLSGKERLAFRFGETLA
jgi:hypothetical protein